MNVHSIYKIILPLFRKRRMQKLIKVFVPKEQTKILDIGGTPMNWLLINCQCRITLLNLQNPENMVSLPRNFSRVVGDGTRLDYSDQEFDICFSNSVIEHLGTFENQMLFAKEACRVGRQIWVQTPASSFFFEPHLLTPFIHYFPKKIQEKLLCKFTLWGLITRPSQKKVKNFLAEVRLLTYDEMVQLFPDCEIRIERFLGFAKAYIAVRV
jgi:hypothetical protein